MMKKKDNVYEKIAKAVENFSPGVFPINDYDDDLLTDRETLRNSDKVGNMCDAFNEYQNELPQIFSRSPEKDREVFCSLMR